MMNGIFMTTRRFYMSDFEIPPPLTRMGGWGGYSGHCCNYLYIRYSPFPTLAALSGPRLRVLEPSSSLRLRTMKQSSGHYGTINNLQLGSVCTLSV